VASFFFLSVTYNVEAEKEPAVVSSAVVENAAPDEIVITMDKALTTVAETTNNATDFTVSGVTGDPTVSKVAVNAKVVTLTLTGNVANGDTVKVSYANTNKILTSTADGDVASFNDQSVTNNVQ
jgi:hypothetical protein